MNAEYYEGYENGRAVGIEKGYQQCQDDVAERLAEVLFKWINEERIIDKKCFAEIEEIAKGLKK